MKAKKLELNKPTKTLYTDLHLWNLKRSKNQIPYKIVNSIINETDDWEWFQTTEDGDSGILRNTKKNIIIKYTLPYPSKSGIYLVGLSTSVSVGGHTLGWDDINKHHIKHSLDILGVSNRNKVVEKEKINSIKEEVMSNLDK